MEGHGTAVAPMLLQTTLQPPQDLSLGVSGSLLSPEKLPGSGASGCSAGKSFGKTKVPSYLGFTCQGKRQGQRGTAGETPVPGSSVVPRRWPGWPRGRGGCWGPSGAHPRVVASPAALARGASCGGPIPAPSHPAAGCTERAGALHGEECGIRETAMRGAGTPRAGYSQPTMPPPREPYKRVCTSLSAPLCFTPSSLKQPGGIPHCHPRSEGGSPQPPLPGARLGSAGCPQRGSPGRTAGAEAAALLFSLARRRCLHASALPEAPAAATAPPRGTGPFLTGPGSAPLRPAAPAHGLPAAGHGVAEAGAVRPPVPAAVGRSGGGRHGGGRAAGAAGRAGAGSAGAGAAGATGLAGFQAVRVHPRRDRPARPAPRGYALPVGDGAHRPRGVEGSGTEGGWGTGSGKWNWGQGMSASGLGWGRDPHRGRGIEEDPVQGGPGSWPEWGWDWGSRAGIGKGSIPGNRDGECEEMMRGNGTGAKEGWGLGQQHHPAHLDLNPSLGQLSHWWDWARSGDQAQGGSGAQPTTQLGLAGRAGPIGHRMCSHSTLAVCHQDRSTVTLLESSI